MIKLYTWLPVAPDTLIERHIAPDLGHCSLEIIDDDGKSELYASYWPEIDNPAGKLTDLLKHRHTRQPKSYKEEIDPLARFMERPADFVDDVEGLDEKLVLRAWSKFRHRRYDLRTWNCSNVAKQMLLAGMSKRDRRFASTASVCGDDCPPLSKFRNALEWLRALVTAPVLTCTPEDVRRLVAAYNDLKVRRHRPIAARREEAEVASTKTA